MSKKKTTPDATATAAAIASETTVEAPAKVPAEAPAEDIELAVRADHITKREKELAELGEYLEEKAEQIEEQTDELSRREKELAKRSELLLAAKEEITEREVAVDEKIELLRETQEQPRGRIRALKVTSRLAPGFCRGGLRFSVSKPSILSMAELTIEQIRVIRAEPNLRVEEILV